MHPATPRLRNRKKRRVGGAAEAGSIRSSQQQQQVRQQQTAEQPAPPPHNLVAPNRPTSSPLPFVKDLLSHLPASPLPHCQSHLDLGKKIIKINN